MSQVIVNKLLALFYPNFQETPQSKHKVISFMVCTSLLGTNTSSQQVKIWADPSQLISGA